MNVGGWLLANGTNSDRITWVRPRESWLLNRRMPSITFSSALTAHLEADSLDDQSGPAAVPALSRIKAESVAAVANLQRLICGKPVAIQGQSGTGHKRPLECKTLDPLT